MAPQLTSHTSIRNAIAQRLVKSAVDAHTPVLVPPTVPSEGEQGPPIEDDIPSENYPIIGEEKLPICIVGAGAAGLYAALILQKLNIDFEILEAEPSEERIGGRMFTHRFNGNAGRDAPVGDAARYDYVDMGAMRFPNLGFFRRVFDLFDYIEIDKLLIEYKMNADNTIMNYNGINIIPSKDDMNKYDLFKVSEKNGGFVPNSYLTSNETNGNPNDGSFWLDKALGSYIQAFKDAAEGTDPDKIRAAIEAAWANVTKHDSLSTRAYMMRPNPTPSVSSNDYPNYPDAVIEWLESLSTGTGLYDEAFVESIIDGVDFGDWNVKNSCGNSNTNKNCQYAWYCIDGGTDRIAMGMLKKLGEANKPKLGKTVTRITPSPDGRTMIVTYCDQHGTPTTKKYSQVICTVPLGCLASIDVSDCSLSYTQKTAIRALNYDASTKVALKFKTRWWEDREFMGDNTIVGGVSSTDLPVRTVVYPSYGLNVKTGGKPPGVMIASYTWAQDARRMGAISDPKDPNVKDLCLRNLATLHSVPLSKLESQYESHYITAWYSEPLARGAFALYGPGQFGSKDDQGLSLFASMKSPAAGGRFHFAGEATSIHHGWVLGALNSAWRAVYNVLAGSPKLRHQLVKGWGIPDEEDVETLRQLYKLGVSGMI